jgi:hypothetical protein
MSEKQKRTLKDVEMEMAMTCQEIGFLEYQLQRDIPNQITKKMNHLHDIHIESIKLRENQEAAHQEAVEALKAGGAQTALGSVQ